MRAVSIAAVFALSNVALAQGNGTTTFTLEDVVMTTCNDREVNLAIGPSGTVHVVYYQVNGCGNCNEWAGDLWWIAKTSGAAWGAPVFVGHTASHRSSIALGAAEVPYVAYSTSDGGTPATTTQEEGVRYSNGSVFLDLGAPLPSGCFVCGGNGGVVLANPTGVVGLALFHGTGEDAVYSTWTGSAWVSTTVESQDRVGKAMCGFLDTASLPVLAYFDQDTSTVHVAEPTGPSAWSISSPPGSHDPSDVDLLPSGDLLLLVRANNQQPPLELFTGGLAAGGTWTPDPNFPGAQYSSGKAVVDPASGAVHVLAMDWTQGRIDYLRPTGTGWIVSPVTSDGRGGDIALDSQGNVVITFVRVSDGMVRLAIEDCDGDVTSYCTAKTNSLGCTPAIGWSGTPSASSQLPFLITASNIVDNRAGIFFYGTSGRNAFTGQCPWSGGGVLCVNPPLKRTPVQMSGGTPWSCEGTFSIDFNAAIQGGSDPNLAVGVTVNGQFWYRDPQAICTTGTTDAIEFTICQ